MELTPNKIIIEKHIPCPQCPSSDAYCLYEDGHGYCFSCKYFKPPKEIANAEDCTLEYLGIRGITRETCRQYDVLTVVDPSGKPRELRFPYVSGIKIRSLDKKDFRWEGESKAGVFGLDKFAAGAHKSIVITEGELDALSLYQILRIPCVSVRSAASAANDVSA